MTQLLEPSRIGEKTSQIIKILHNETEGTHYHRQSL